MENWKRLALIITDKQEKEAFKFYVSRGVGPKMQTVPKHFSQGNMLIQNLNDCVTNDTQDYVFIPIRHVQSGYCMTYNNPKWSWYAYAILKF